jgi:hypothetical protein
MEVQKKEKPMINERAKTVGKGGKKERVEGIDKK